MKETRQQKADRERNERIRLAQQRLQEAQSTKDIGMWVTHEGMGLLTNMLGNSVERMVKDAVRDSIKELFEGYLEGMIKQAVNDTVQQAVSNEITEYELPPAVDLVLDKQVVEQYEDIMPEADLKPGRMRWTKQHDKVVVEAVAHCESMNDAFETAATMLGRTTKSVAGRWYGKLADQDEEGMSNELNGG
jgi:hypothetical protein